MNKRLFLTCHGGVGIVTGANFLLEDETGRTRILVDCGMIQGVPDAAALNREPFPYDPASVQNLFVTHAHLDHIGRIPLLIKNGFKGAIYSTPATFRLAAIMFDDTVGILDEEARRTGVLPLYGKEEVATTLSLWREIPYHSELEIGDGIKVFAKDAGHVLGSAMYEFRIGGKTIVFTGDLGNSPSPLLRDTESIKGANYCVMESVYGDRDHEAKTERRSKLADLVKEIVARKGTLLVPAFSLERTQVLLSELNDLVESGQLPAIPVFLDSPLAIRVTEVYKEFRADFNEQTRRKLEHDDIFSFPKLRFTMHGSESSAIQKMPGPKVIIAGSGMSEGGRIRGHERHCLPDRRNILLLIGYQAPGTLGRELLEGVKQVKIDGETVRVAATVASIQGYSSHKDSSHLLEFAADAGDSLERVFVVMGEPRASLFLVQRLRDYVGLDAIYPTRGRKYELVF